MTEHCLIKPSAMDRLMQCRGALSMERLYPQPPGPKAEEGTLAHTVASNRLLRKDEIYGPEVSEEMLEGSDLWFETFGKYNGVQVEKRLTINDNCWGTCDAWVYHEGEGVLRIGDYKFGHVYVEAKDNWQLITYAVAWCIENKTWPQFIEVTIVQPRCFTSFEKVRSWIYTGEEMRQFCDEILVNNDLILKGNTPCVTGNECLYCKARHACPTYLKSVSNVWEYIGEPVPFDLSEAALSKELTALNDAFTLLKGRRSGIEAELMNRMKAGSVVPGWMLKNSYGREEWDKPINEVVGLGLMWGIDLSKPGAITPKQAIKAGIPEEIVRSYSAIKNSELKLVPDDWAKAKAVFGGN